MLKPSPRAPLPVPKPKNEYHYSPLHLAARFGANGTLDLLLDKGADVNSKMASEQTPLHLLLGNDAYDVVRERMQAAERDMAAWEKTGRDVDFDAA